MSRASDVGVGFDIAAHQLIVDYARLAAPGFDFMPGILPSRTWQEPDEALGGVRSYTFSGRCDEVFDKEKIRGYALPALSHCTSLTIKERWETEVQGRPEDMLPLARPLAIVPREIDDYAAFNLVAEWIYTTKYPSAAMSRIVSTGLHGRPYGEQRWEYVPLRNAPHGHDRLRSLLPLGIRTKREQQAGEVMRLAADSERIARIINILRTKATSNS